MTYIYTAKFGSHTATKEFSSRKEAEAEKRRFKKIGKKHKVKQKITIKKKKSFWG